MEDRDEVHAYLSECIAHMSFPLPKGMSGRYWTSRAEQVVFMARVQREVETAQPGCDADPGFNEVLARVTAGEIDVLTGLLQVGGGVRAVVLVVRLQKTAAGRAVLGNAFDLHIAACPRCRRRGDVGPVVIATGDWGHERHEYNASTSLRVTWERRRRTDP